MLESAPPRSAPSLAIPLAALALSGAAGLVDEVVWSRALAVLFGSALAATGLLLGLFMAGLGAGSVVGGRWAARTRRPLALFGAAEIGIGVLVFLTPALFRWAAPLVVRWDVHLPDSLAPIVPTAVSLTILAPIIVLMGATFPLFLAHVARDPKKLAADSGKVYGINTAGAVVGTLAGGFILLPAFGIERSLFLAAATDVVVGAICLAIALRDDRCPGELLAVPEEGSTSAPPAPVSKSPGRLALTTALLGGAAALTLEVAWFRGFVLIFGSSVYALSLMLAAFLLGLAGGAIVLARRFDRESDLRAPLGRLHLLVAFSATLVTIVIQILPFGYIALLSGGGGSFGIVSAGSFVLLVALLLVPTSLMGAALPTAIRLGASGGVGSTSAGRIYAASSIGSAAGALGAGFLFVPAFGIRGAVGVAVALSLAAGAVALAKVEDRAARKTALQIGVLAAGLWGAWLGGFLPWDWRILTAGYYAYAPLYSGDRQLPPGPVRRTVEMSDPMPFGGATPKPMPPPAKSGTPRLLSWEDGQFAQVAVVQDGETRMLLLNGKADASNGPADMRTQTLLGALPVLLAPAEPGGRAMVIGLGSGVTAGAVAAWPFRSIVVAEIEPAVVRASKYFDAENRHFAADPRVRFRIDDGRRILDRETEPLALITSEPTNLWMSGVTLLFTREFFELAAARLGETGVLCQWLHLYQVGPDDVRTLLATLAGPFPHLAVVADGSDLLIVASRSPLNLDPERWRARLENNPGAREALARAGLTSAAELAAGLVADRDGILRWAGAAVLHTDDRPILEFSAAKWMGRDHSGPILASMVESAVAAGPIALGKDGRVTGARPGIAP